MKEKLKKIIIPIKKLSLNDKERMFYLMNCHYENIIESKFLADLEEKEGVLLLNDAEGLIQGFSTYLIFDFMFKDKAINIMFSGDTVLNKIYWGTNLPFKIFADLIDHLMKKYNNELYWFLISKGYRTYLFLPLLFKSFYPSPVYSISKDDIYKYEQLTEELSIFKFKSSYDIENRIIRSSGDFLKHELTGNENYFNKKNRFKMFTDFFYKNNPGFDIGNELPCIAKIDHDNLTSLAKRFISK